MSRRAPPSRTPTHQGEKRGSRRPRRRSSSSRAGGVTISTSLRVTHCPVNTAGVPWQNVLALRRKGVDARLVVFERYKLHPEADWSLDRARRLRPPAARSSGARSRGSLPQTDVFHFYFGLTLVPKSLQFPLLRALGKRSVMHFLGSDIRGKPPAELAWATAPAREIVGSYDAIRWVPDADVVPPGIDLREYTPRAARPTRARPVVLHAPPRRRKGTEHVIAACEQLPVELEIVEGLHHDEARRRYERADIVVDQLNAGWYGLFAIEAMALGKPVVTFLHDEAVERTEKAFGTEVPIVSATAETLPTVSAPSSRTPPSAARRRREPRLRRAGPRRRPGRRPPARIYSRGDERSARSSSGSAAHSAIYGLGGLVSRILAVLLLPLYTQLPRPARLRQDRDRRRADDRARDRPPHRDLERLLPLLLRHEGRGAADARRPHVVLVHDGDGDARARRRLDLRRPRSRTGSGSATTRGSSAPAFVGLWAQMNYEQLTSLFRVEERSTAFVARQRRERADHGRRDGAPRRRLDKGATGAVVGNFIGTLCVYFVLLGYRRYQLGLQFSRDLLRADEPLRDAARPLGARAVGDQLHRPALHRAVQGPGRGRRLLGRGADLVGDRLPDDRVPTRLAGVRLLDRGRPRGEADVLVRAHLPALRLRLGRRSRSACSRPGWSTCSPRPGFQRVDRRGRAPRLRRPAYAGYTVSRSASAARARRSSTGSSPACAAVVNVGLNVALIPPYGMIGAAVAMLAAYSSSSSGWS